LGLAVPLLAGSAWPLLGWPVLLPIYTIAPKFGALLSPASLFPHTVPIYASNILDRGQATATIVDVAYSITIGGVRYAPVVRTACTSRTMVDVDYGSLQFFDKFPTASGGELIAQAGDATLVLDQSPQLCERLRRLKLGPLVDVPLRRFYVVRGEADKTQVYELQYTRGAVAIDDIALQLPEIVRIDEAPAKEVIGLDALWPMRRPNESGYDRIPLIEAYRHLPARENSCIARNFVTVDSVTMMPKVSRRSSTDYPDYIPVTLRPAYCRLVLWWRIPQPARSRLNPLAG
jgi:hypothetical protein